MLPKKIYQVCLVLLSGVFSFFVIGRLIKLNDEQQTNFITGELLCYLLLPALSFFGVLYLLFRPKIPLEKKLLWLVSFISLNIFTYIGTFFAIFSVSLRNENLSFLVGTTTSGISALIAGYILKKVANIENNARNVFLGGAFSWLLANSLQVFFSYLQQNESWTSPHFGFYGFVSVYIFWQMAIAYNCLKAVW